MRAIDADALIEFCAEQWIPLNVDAVNMQPTIPIAKLKEQPEVIRCKDCRHWKDSDGVFRRGIDAESKCPINSHQVYEGTFFCGMAERRTYEQPD